MKYLNTYQLFETKDPKKEFYKKQDDLKKFNNECDDYLIALIDSGKFDISKDLDMDNELCLMITKPVIGSPFNWMSIKDDVNRFIEMCSFKLVDIYIIKMIDKPFNEIRHGDPCATKKSYKDTSEIQNAQIMTAMKLYFI